MGVFDTYSKRRKRQESHGEPEVYQYEDVPAKLRIQIAQIWRDALGRWFRPRGYSYAPSSASSTWWEFINRTLSKEKGVWHLGGSGNDPQTQCVEYLLEADTNGALDIIELSFKVLDRGVRDFASGDRETAHITQNADDAIEELNDRFREHGVGYQYVGGEIVRVDSQLLHAEVVKPALSLLHGAGFKGPVDEFMRAFDHYRNGEGKDAIADALSAFESTMKAICDARRWKYGPKDTAKGLLDILFKNGLIPPELASHFSGLRSALESGLPTVANPNRHGQGSQPKGVPPHYVAYALHLLASNVVFLVECHKNLK